MNKIFKYVGALALAGSLTLQTNNVFAKDACQNGQTENTAYFMFLNSGRKTTYDAPDIHAWTAADKANVVGSVGTDNLLSQWMVPVTNGSQSTSLCKDASGRQHCVPWTVEEYWRNYYNMWKHINDNSTTQDGKDLVYRKNTADGVEFYVGHIAWRRYHNEDFSGTPDQFFDSEVSTEGYQKSDLIKYLESHINNLGSSDLVKKGTNLPVTTFNAPTGLGTAESDLKLSFQVTRNYDYNHQVDGFVLGSVNDKVYSPGVYAVRFCTGKATPEEPDTPPEEPKKVTLTYDANGGTGAPDSINFSEGECVDIDTKVPVRDGYTFLGWTEQKDGSGDKYSKDGKYGSKQYCKGTATIYAQWKKNEKNKNTLKFDKNTTDVVDKIPSDVTFEEGTCVEKISTNIPTRDGYIFKGWNTKINGTGSPYSPGDKYCGESATLYAQWDPKKNENGSYTIKYDANGGKDAPADQIGKVGECLKISTAKPTNGKRKFLGWSRDPRSSTPDSRYEADSEYCEDANVTLYAVWDVENPKTGVSTHLVAFAAAALTAGAALIIAKKKDLFKQI